MIGTAPWCFGVCLGISRGVCLAESYDLKATPKTVLWGYYSASAMPVLRIKSGDQVRIETVSTGSPARFEAAGVPPNQIPDNFRRIYREVTDKGPGGHILTGPIHVEGAEPGDVLEVRILAIEMTLRLPTTDSVPVPAFCRMISPMPALRLFRSTGSA